ncbi:hypothetical protein ACIQMP_06320 [Streptomyces sp. NPDC091385]|uniref:hypothetical protein n=1 Tax=Streptomyces sp. NPDC091385 TaxID=3365997 RepID=UPI00380B95C5
MTQTARPSLVSEADALSVAGSGAVRYEMGPAVIAAGADATVVVVEAGDNPRVSGVQDAHEVLLSREPVPDLSPRFEFEDVLPVHVFVRLNSGCFPLGTARCRGRSVSPAGRDGVGLRLDVPLAREVLDLVRPVPESGPVPDVNWVDLVETDPVRALEAFVVGWFPAEESEGAESDELAALPPPLAAFHCLARLRPALHRFHDPVLKVPERATGPLGDRLVFAVWNGAVMDWSIPWPLESSRSADPPVWHTEDPCDNPETFVEEEPLSRFLLQFTLAQAIGGAPFHASTSSMPTARFDALRGVLRPVPLSPFLPTYTAERFFVAPGLLAQVSGDEDEVSVFFGALHRGSLTPLLDHGFPWIQFDG